MTWARLPANWQRQLRDLLGLLLARLPAAQSGQEAEHDRHPRSLYQGKLNKARRGALMGPPSIGYVRLASGEWAVDPDEQVQATVRLLFDQFDRETTQHGLLRCLAHHGVRIPVQSPSGPNRGELEWRPNRVTPSNLLHHPSYAEAYRYGHRQTELRPATSKIAFRIQFEPPFWRASRDDADGAGDDRPSVHERPGPLTCVLGPAKLDRMPSRRGRPGSEG